MTDQDTNRENLGKLLSFLKERILSRQENRWFSEALLAELSPSGSDKISDIYEQCIESILTEQANEFYKDFVIEELRPQLIRDFIKMEHWRRRNDIGEFGMAVFQQVECIINHLSRNLTLGEVCRLMMNVKCYVESDTAPVSARHPKSTYLIGQLLFMNDAPTKSVTDLSQQWVFDKFKCINYFVCHKASLTFGQFNQFTEENRIFGSIYALRNTNHRGNVSTDKVTERLKDISSNPSRAFLTLTSFLTWFVDHINAGWPLSSELVRFSQSNTSSLPVSAVGPTVVGKIDLKDDGRKRFK